MKYFIKILLSRIARPFGLEIVRYTPGQRERLRNRRHLRYKDLVVEEALAMTGEISVSEARFLGNLVRDLHYSITKKILANAKEELNVKQVRLDKKVFYETYSGESPALVFLDAIHEYKDSKEDLYWDRQINADKICGHDYDNLNFPGVVEAVNEFGGYRHLKESLWVL